MDRRSHLRPTRRPAQLAADRERSGQFGLGNAGSPVRPSIDIGLDPPDDLGCRTDKGFPLRNKRSALVDFHRLALLRHTQSLVGTKPQSQDFDKRKERC